MEVRVAECGQGFVMPSKRVAIDLGTATARALEITKSGDGLLLVAGGRVPVRADPNLPPDR